MLADLVLKGRLPWIFTENERSLLAIDLDSTAAQRSSVSAVTKGNGRLIFCATIKFHVILETLFSTTV